MQDTDKEKVKNQPETSSNTPPPSWKEAVIRNVKLESGLFFTCCKLNGQSDLNISRYKRDKVVLKFAFKITSI